MSHNSFNLKRLPLGATGLVITSDLFAKAFLLLLDAFIIATLPATQIASYLAYSFWLRFAPYCGMGSISYVNKTLPQTKSEEEQFKIISEAAHLTFLISGCLLVAGTLGRIFQIIDNVIFFPIISIALVQVMSLQQAIWRGTFRFGTYCISQSIQAFGALSIGILLIPAWKIGGVYTALASSYALAILVWLFTRHPSQPNAIHFNLTTLPSLRPIKMGLSFFILGVMLFAMQSLDRMSALWFGDVQTQTTFGVGFLFYQAGIICINSLGKVATPIILAHNKQDTEKNTENDGTFFLVLSCLAVFIVCLFAIIIGYNMFDKIIPQRFIEAKNVSLFYLSSGFITAVGLSFIPKLVKSSSEWKVILIVNFIIISTIVLLFLFVVPPLLPTQLAQISITISCLFAVSTIFLVWKLSKNDDKTLFLGGNLFVIGVIAITPIFLG